MWKEFEKDYYVNKKGQIKKENYKRTNDAKILRLYKHSKNKNCYLVVAVKDKILYVHRIVAQAFLPNPNNYPCVNHKDGNKNNNNVNNLEWCTYSENMKHAVKNKLCVYKYGENNKNSIRYVELDKNYNYIRTFVGSKNEDKKLGYSNDSIAKCSRGKILSTHNKIYLKYDDYINKTKEELKKFHKEIHKKFLKLNTI